MWKAIHRHFINQAKINASASLINNENVASLNQTISPDVFKILKLFTNLYNYYLNKLFFNGKTRVKSQNVNTCLGVVNGNI